jgi:hypothetical protein
MTEITHGGRRSGAGRPTKDAQQDSIASFHAARCRKENALADLRRMEADALAGRLYDRGEVLRVIATTIAVFAEQVRSIPDKLERENGLTGRQAEAAERVIDDHLEMIRDRLLAIVPKGTHPAAADILRAMAEQLERRGTA